MKRAIVRALIWSLWLMAALYGVSLLESGII
jgi:hypothetical protein